MLVLAAVLISVLITGVVVVFGLQLFGGTSVAEARREAETIRREAKIEAREDAVRVRSEVEREIAEQRSRITKIEERVIAREDEVEGRQKELSRREQGITDATLARFADAGVDVAALAAKLQSDGAASFVASWNDLLACISAQREALAHPSP